MPPKAPVTTPSTAATTSGNDTSMADTDSQVVTMGQLQEIVDQLTNNNAILEDRINGIGASKIKLPSVERFTGEKSKLKGFLAQMSFKVTQEGAKLATPMDKVVYAGLFLSGRALEWFEPYLTEIQKNGLTTTNPEVRYMFATWAGFVERLTQMFGDPEATTTAERKLQNLVQRTSTIEYTTQFQTLATQVEWNDKALMAQYKQGLKAKVQDAIILMEDADTLRELIDQAIKIDNRIYQREQAKKGQDRVPQSYKAQSTQRQTQSQKPWYGAEPMDLSGTKESKKWNKKPWKPRGQGSSDRRTKEQRPNQGSQEQKTFRRTPQQSQWFRDGACMNCGKQGHFARDCRGGQSNHAVKGTRPAEKDTYVQRDDGALRGTKECSINSFAFCYNNACRIHEDAKYGASYWPQEPVTSKFRGTEEPARRPDIEDDEFDVGEAFTDDEATKAAYWEHADLGEVETEAETETTTERGSVTGIMTPLDTISIASRDDRSNVQKKLGKQTTVSASSSLDKGKRPQAQESQEEMRDAQDSQDAMRHTQGPTTDENRWGRAAAQFEAHHMSTGRKFKNHEFGERIRTSIPGEQGVQPEDRKVDTRIKKHDDFEDPAARRRKQETMDEFRARIIAWQEQKLDRRSTAGRTKDRAPVRRVTNRPSAGTPRAKWLDELEQEEDLDIPVRFEERHTKGCHDAAMTRYFLTEKPYTLNQLYGKWYRQRHNDEWEDFYMWLDEKVVQDQPITEKRMSHIKGALIMTSRNLEEGSRDWRSERQISVPAAELPVVRSTRYRFELKSEDEPRVDPRHAAHHTLSWIACVEDTCNMHRAPKDKNRKYPARMYWAPEEKRFRDAKYMHGWHPVEVQSQGDLTLQPGRFLTEECLDGRQWWDCPENTCPWHVEEKKRTKYWPKMDQVQTRSSSQQPGKGEAHGTRGNQW